jgi:lysozyme
VNDEQILADLRRDEGEVLHAYQDSEGYWTIGIGTLIDKRNGGGITHDEAVYLALNRISRKREDLDAMLPWWRTLSEVRQRVLLNMAFNLGVSGLLEFRRMLAGAQRGDYQEAAREMLDSKWAIQVGDRAERLAMMMREG